MCAFGRIIRAGLSIVEKDTKPKTLDEVIVNIVVNGAKHANFSIVKKASENSKDVVFPRPSELNDRDTINFISRSSNPDVTHAYISILIELDYLSNA